MAATSVVFARQPPADAYRPKRTYIRHGDIARALRATPGAWARVSQHPTRQTAASVASAIRRANRPSTRAYVPAGDFAADYVTTETGEHVVYACYTGAATRRANGIRGR